MESVGIPALTDHNGWADFWYYQIGVNVIPAHTHKKKTFVEWKRWQIESLFKRMKQNYPLKYFLGDSENAIKIQIWCSLIADLLLKIVKKAVAVKWSFSNLAAMVRLHLMTYIDLFNFLKSPEKSLLKIFSQPIKQNNYQLLLVT